MPRYAEMAERLNGFEQVLGRFFRRDPNEESRAVNGLIESFNAWMEAGHAELEQESASLERDMEPVRQLGPQVESIDQQLGTEKPDTSDPASVEVFNRRVRDRNALVAKQKELYEAYKRKEQAYNERVKGHNEESARRKQEVEKARQAADQAVEEYNRWVKERKAERFFQDVNQLYASLRQETRRPGAGTAELEGCLGRARAIRRELGLWAQKQQQSAEHGVLIVPALLCGVEESFLVVDNGASVTSISAELVEALGLSDRVGEEVEVRLAGDIQVQAPRIEIPSVSVQGAEVEQVQGVVLKGPQCGVDGCLGLSFLDSFHYEITKGKLALVPRRATAEPAFDVFICYKSEDLAHARTVFDAVSLAGHRPFLSEVSLPELAEADFQRAINKAIEAARHLVVVASSRKTLESSWVEGEWSMFLGLKRSGRKPGNIVSVLCGGLAEQQLPAALAQYQAIRIDDPGWREKLKAFLP